MTYEEQLKELTYSTADLLQCSVNNIEINVKHGQVTTTLIKCQLIHISGVTLDYLGSFMSSEPRLSIIAELANNARDLFIPF